ncbi:MAG: murein L,D-transpeptidase catalytic domain-containing protein [Gemmatimonadota bacterium]
MRLKVVLAVFVVSLLASTTPARQSISAAPAPVTLAPVVATPSTNDGLVETALSALASDVRNLSHSDALRMAFEAYYNYKAENPRRVRNPYFYFVDYGLDNRTPRGYVFDMEQLKLVEGPFIVAHGRGSSNGKNAVPMRFSNRHGSATTSLGLYVAAETYNFSGKSGGRHYTSIGLRMDGVSGQFNSAARARGVVAHGAPYVTASRAGRSEGCPAMEQARARRLLPKLANGGLVFLFSPNDDNWMKRDPWAGAAQS